MVIFSWFWPFWLKTAKDKEFKVGKTAWHTVGRQYGQSPWPFTAQMHHLWTIQIQKMWFLQRLTFPRNSRVPGVSVCSQYEMFFTISLEKLSWKPFCYIQIYCGLHGLENFLASNPRWRDWCWHVASQLFSVVSFSVSDMYFYAIIRSLYIYFG